MQLTAVLSFRLDRSKVVPDGTATLERIMVEHDACDLLADDAPLEPEKVQVVALFAIAAGSGGGVMAGAGWATGEANTNPPNAASRVQVRSMTAKEYWQC
jgi:hypothetical protein